MPRGGADDVDHLWAMAAELERQFAGYKRRVAARRRGCGGEDEDDVRVAAGAGTLSPDVVARGGKDGGGVAGGAGTPADHDDVRGGGGGGSSNRGEEAAEGGDVRGRMYEAYTRRRDERLRSGWRARMDRKEAEVMALWAQLDRGGRASVGGGDTSALLDGGGDRATAADLDGGEVQQEPDDGGDAKRRSSDVAAPPRRISGNKHARARSSDVGSSGKEAHRGRAIGGVGPGTAAPKRKATMSPSKGSTKEHGSLKPAAGPKTPRSPLARRCSSGSLEGLGEAAPAQTSCSGQQLAADSGGAQEASPSTPLLQSDANGGTDTASTRDDASQAAAGGGEAGAKNVDVEKRDGEEIPVSPEKLGSGEISGDSETEPSYVYIVKKVVVDVEENSMRHFQALRPGSDAAKPHLEGENGTGDADEATTVTATVDGASFAAESATTNVEEAAAARESFDESSFSGRSARGSPPNVAPFCTSRAQPIERPLEADGRRNRDESATVSTPGSAGSRVSAGATPRTSTSPRDTPRGFKKRFLSFGKKSKGREPSPTTIGCASPSVVDGGGATADSIKPTTASSDAASDDADHGRAASPHACSLQSLVAASPAKSELGEIVTRQKSPKAHRSLFSLRSFNCGRS